MQEARKVFVLQWLLMRHPPLAFHPSLSANSKQFGTADQDAIVQRTLSASAGAEQRPIAPDRVLTGR
jgi:hypothetical protein